VFLDKGNFHSCAAVSGTYRIGFLDSLTITLIARNPIPAGGGFYLELPDGITFEGTSSSLAVSLSGVSQTFTSSISGQSITITDLFASDYSPDYETIIIEIQDVRNPQFKYELSDAVVVNSIDMDGNAIDDPANPVYLSYYNPGYAKVTFSQVSTTKVAKDFDLEITVTTDILLTTAYGYTLVLEIPSEVSISTSAPSNCSSWVNISSSSTCVLDSSLKTITV